MKIHYLGHSAVMLEGSKTVLIDPFLTSDREPPSSDIIAITHAHADHMGKISNLKSVVVTNNEIAHFLIKKGLQAEPMNIGGTIEIFGISFTMTCALHSSWIEEAGIGMYGGVAAGFIITIDGICVYHAGDTGLFGDMRLIGEIYSPDIAFIPIGGRYTMGPREAMIAADYIGAPIIIPIHYNTTPRIMQDAEEFKRVIDRTTDMRVIILEPGEVYEPGSGA